MKATKALADTEQNTEMTWMDGMGEDTLEVK